MNPPHWVSVLQFLARFDPEDLEFSCPLDVTQHGIASACGLSRAHVAMILRRDLVGRGFVECRLLHVQGNGRRRLGYVLTPAGFDVVRGKFF